jgi:hypothetical protein
VNDASIDIDVDAVVADAACRISNAVVATIVHVYDRVCMYGMMMV